LMLPVVLTAARTIERWPRRETDKASAHRSSLDRCMFVCTFRCNAGSDEESKYASADHPHTQRNPNATALRMPQTNIPPGGCQDPLGASMQRAVGKTRWLCRRPAKRRHWESRGRTLTGLVHQSRTTGGTRARLRVARSRWVPASLRHTDASSLRHTAQATTSRKSPRVRRKVARGEHPAQVIVVGHMAGDVQGDSRERPPDLLSASHGNRRGSKCPGLSGTAGLRRRRTSTMRWGR
jgi:hypothetical protein